MREAPGVEQRRGDHRPLPRLERDLLEQRGDRVERLRLAPARALRLAGRARGQDQRLALLGRRVEVGGVAAGDQVVDRAVGPVAPGLVPGDEALAAGGRALDQLRELLVEDHRDRVLALGDVGQLRAGEGGVEEQRVRPELVDRDVGLDPAAVVAAHDRHAVARADALGAQRVGERVRALVDLRERQRPGLVDQREAVGMARCGGLVAGGRGGAPADQCAQGVVQAVGPLRAQDPRARERRDGLGLAGDEGGARELHGGEVCHPFGSASPDGTAPVSISRWMSAARRGLRNTWRWPTDGFSASSPASSSASPTACASAAVVAGEAACEVREVGVVAAPLPHAVEPLEDPAGDAQGRVGIGVRGHAAVRARLQQREHGVLVLLDRALVRGAAAEPRDRLGDPQRVPRTDRRPQRDLGEHRAGDRVRRRAQPVDPARVIVEGERDELVERDRVDPRRRQRDDEEAVEVAGGDADRAGVGRRAGLGEVAHRAQGRRDHEPFALARPARGRPAARRAPAWRRAAARRRGRSRPRPGRRSPSA